MHNVTAILDIRCSNVFHLVSFVEFEPFLFFILFVFSATCTKTQILGLSSREKLEGEQMIPARRIQFLIDAGFDRGKKPRSIVSLKTSEDQNEFQQFSMTMILRHKSFCFKIISIIADFSSSISFDRYILASKTIEVNSVWTINTISKNNIDFQNNWNFFPLQIENIVMTIFSCFFLFKKFRSFCRFKYFVT